MNTEQTRYARIEAAARAGHAWNNDDEHVPWDECGSYIKKWYREFAEVVLAAADGVQTDTDDSCTPPDDENCHRCGGVGCESCDARFLPGIQTDTARVRDAREAIRQLYWWIVELDHYPGPVTNYITDPGAQVFALHALAVTSEDTN